MSEPKRYMVHRNVQVPCGCVQDELIDCESSNPRCRTLVDYSDYDRLKAEVERMTKAGDELHAFLINYIVESRISSAYLNKLDDGWLAAKEGKQP